MLRHWIASIPFIVLLTTLPINDFSGKLNKYNYSLIVYGTLSFGFIDNLN